MAKQHDNSLNWMQSSIISITKSLVSVAVLKISVWVTAL